MKEKKVSIIIVNWNGKEFLKDCFDSINQNVYNNYEIIVVDNGSSDGSCDFIKSQYKDVILIKNNDNLGFAEGNNIGIDFALSNRAEYVLLLNNDTVVDPHFIDKLVKVAESDPQVGIVGSMVYFMDNPKKICFAGGRRKWNTQWAHIGLEEIDEGQYDEVTETEYIYGCALMLKREVIKRVGVFDPDYFTYVEEVDLNYRVQKAGYKIVFVPQSKVWHKIAASNKGGRTSPVRQYYMTRNNLLFLKKNGTPLDILKFSILVLPKWFIKAVISLRHETSTFRATIRGLADFFNGKFGKVNLS